jgi:hypothetical protein
MGAPVSPVKQGFSTPQKSARHPPGGFSNNFCAFDFASTPVRSCTLAPLPLVWIIQKQRAPQKNQLSPPAGEVNCESVGTFHIYTDERGRKEPGIYEDDQGTKYLRLHEDGRRFYSYVALKTTSITEAIKLRDARRTAGVAHKLGVTAISPEEASKLAQVTVPVVIKRYQKDGYPNKRGVPWPDGRHRKAEEKYCETISGHAVQRSLHAGASHCTPTSQTLC